MTLNGRFNLLLNELREKREDIAEQRRKGDIGLKEFWNLRMNLEDHIQDTETKRDLVVKQIVALFPKTK
jgi:hypothetical protein